MSLSGRAGAKDRPRRGRRRRAPVRRRRGEDPAAFARGPGAVSRTALVNRLRAGRSARAVSVVAPGGYGKTTLLAQWAARDDRPFAWVSLDRRDNDPVVLLRHVAAAINEIIPVDPRLLDALAAPNARSGHRFFRGSLRSSPPRTTACSCSTTPTRFSRRTRRRCSRSWPSTFPTGSTLVLSSRVESVLVTRLRSTSTLLEIGASDLALTRREAELLLRGAGARLSDEAFAELIERTEGWAGALYLASLSLKRPGAGRARAASARGRLGGDDRYLADYFHSEYLGALAPERLRFLRRTSVLEKMSGALCDAMLDSNQSFDELEALKHSNLFLVPLDDDGIWYRYHHLFRDLLRRELLETEPELAKELGGRAADWLEAHGDAESALEHALDVGDMERAARIFAEIALPTYCSGRAATVELWLGTVRRPRRWR